MANEIELEENPGGRKGLRGLAHARQTLSIGGAASSAFNASTRSIAVRTSTDCKVEIGANPNGSGLTTPIYADDGWRDFPVAAGLKLIAIA
jgi:hypothetical protein